MPKAILTSVNGCRTDRLCLIGTNPFSQAHSSQGIVHELKFSRSFPWEARLTPCHGTVTCTPGFRPRCSANHSATESTPAVIPDDEKNEKSTICVVTGIEIPENDEEARRTQEDMLEKLGYASWAFISLGVTRVIDTLPSLFSSENRYDEIITLVSAVDPLLVGILALSTRDALRTAFFRWERQEESTAEMRADAMKSLVEFFDKANTVVFGIALATIFRVAFEVVSKSEIMGNFGEKFVELLDIFKALEDISVTR